MRIQKLMLQLVNCEELSLFSINIWDSDYHEPRQIVRGRMPGAFAGAGTFQWTKAVRAITLLFVRHKLLQYSPDNRAFLCGGKNSLASSLDYAISKNTAWLCDMFGTTANGACRATRLILRCNSHRKRPGPVILAINSHMIRPNQIEIRLGDKILDAVELKWIDDCLSKIEPKFQEGELFGSRDLLSITSDGGPVPAIHQSNAHNELFILQRKSKQS